MQSKPSVQVHQTGKLQAPLELLSLPFTTDEKAQKAQKQLPSCITRQLLALVTIRAPQNKNSRIEGNLHHPLAMATPPQGAGNSNDLRTPVNATQGARDFLVNDDYQFNFDDFIGPRPSDTTNSDAAQQDSRAISTPAASGNTLLDSPHFQFSGSTPVTVGQDADRLINELTATAPSNSDCSATCARPLTRQPLVMPPALAWAHPRPGVQEEASPLPLPPRRAAAPKLAAKTTTYASVASQPEGPTTYSLKTQRPTKRATQRAKAPPAEDLRLMVRLEPDAPTWDKEAYAIRRAVADRSEIPLHRVLAATRTKMGWAIKPTDAPTRDLLLAKEASWTSTLGASKVDRHGVWHTYVVKNCPRRLFSLTEESIDVLEAAKEEVLTQTAWQPVDGRTPYMLRGATTEKASPWSHRFYGLEAYSRAPGRLFR
ncbi:hypothetical protein E4U11_001617 [Claviceps purpurea]|nr:hypothetical protein E4U11_001617 [Claviceps purpurea]